MAGGEADTLNSSRPGQAFALLPSSDSLSLGRSDSPRGGGQGGPASLPACFSYSQAFSAGGGAKGLHLSSARMLELALLLAVYLLCLLGLGHRWATVGGAGYARVLLSEAGFKYQCCLP